VAGVTIGVTHFSPNPFPQPINVLCDAFESLSRQIFTFCSRLMKSNDGKKIPKTPCFTVFPDLTSDFDVH
jgi:hypothetical protein